MVDSRSFRGHVLVKVTRTDLRLLKPRRTVTVKFRADQLSPAQMEERLGRAVQNLVQAGAIHSPNVEAVFGPDFEPDLRSVFTIDFVGSADQLLSKLNALDRKSVV